MAPTFLKLPLLLTVAWFYDRAFASPNAPASAAERQLNIPRHTRHTVSTEEIPKTTYWAFTLTEVAAILDPYFSTSASAPDHAGLLQMSPTFLLGTALILIGVAIRLRCYRELGRHFTFALSLRDGHALISSGPYAIVRHPSYTGGMMTLVGAPITMLGGGSWFSGGRNGSGWFNDGGAATPRGKFLALNLIAATALYVPASLRGAREDAYLRRFFGAEWDQYAARVRYRYIPGVW
ncbi:hypothetical protein C8R43DRAFT_902444 [Mycena crocata]|nr:hypothetical protein C8R43DRAFT_902444 [Mycena crocata]